MHAGCFRRSESVRRLRYLLILDASRFPRGRVSLHLWSLRNPLVSSHYCRCRDVSDSSTGGVFDSGLFRAETPFPLLGGHTAFTQQTICGSPLGSFHMLSESRCGSATSGWSRTLGTLSNCFDCVRAHELECRKFDGGYMYTIIAGAVLVLSIGILIAHAMDGFRSN